MTCTSSFNVTFDIKKTFPEDLEDKYDLLILGNFKGNPVWKKVSAIFTTMNPTESYFMPEDL